MTIGRCSTASVAAAIRTRSACPTPIAVHVRQRDAALERRAVNSVGTATTRRRPAAGASVGSTTPATATSCRREVATHEFKAGGYFTREWYQQFQEASVREGHGGVGHDYLLYFSNSVPFEVLLYNSPFLSENNVDYQSGYFRDNWRIGDRLTLSFGLRVERYNAFLPEQSKPAGPFSAAADYAHDRPLRLVASSPRFGLSYPLPRTTAPSSRRPTGASTSRCARRTRRSSATSTRTTTPPRATAGTI